MNSNISFTVCNQNLCLHLDTHSPKTNMNLPIWGPHLRCSTYVLPKDQETLLCCDGDRLPTEVVDSPSLETAKSHLDMVMGSQL